MNYYKHHIGDYDSHTAHLSWLEDCAYQRLMRVYYRTEKPIPADLKQAWRLVRASNKAERAAVEQVLREFFELQEDGWHQKRCDEHLREEGKKSELARASAMQRWNKSDPEPHSDGNANAYANASKTHSDGNAPHSHSPFLRLRMPLTRPRRWILGIPRKPFSISA